MNHFLPHFYIEGIAVSLSTNKMILTLSLMVQAIKIARKIGVDPQGFFSLGFLRPNVNFVGGRKKRE